MKCRIDSGNSCRRCERAGLPCIFVPRANASAFMVPASLPLTEMASYDVTRDILRRVKAIEDHVGIHDAGKVGAAPSAPEYANEVPEKTRAKDSTWNLWEILAPLEDCAMPSYSRALWTKGTVEELFQTYAITFCSHIRHRSTVNNSLDFTIKCQDCISFRTRGFFLTPNRSF